MKKILFFACSALFIGLSSCSSDDENDDGLPQLPSRKLEKIEEFNDNGELMLTETFTYDAQGRWTKSERISHSWTSNDPNYVPKPIIQILNYNGDKITYSFSGYDKYTEIFSLKNNLISTRHEEGTNESWATDYHYSNGYLTKLDDGGYATFEYTDGNLTKVTEDEGRETYNISYTDHLDLQGINIFEASYNDGDLDIRPNSPLYQMGYYGKKSKHLIESIRYAYRNGGLV